MGVIFHNGNDFGRAVGLKTSGAGVGSVKFGAAEYTDGWLNSAWRGVTNVGKTLSESPAGRGAGEVSRRLFGGGGPMPEPAQDFPERPEFGGKYGFILGIRGGFADDFNWTAAGNSTPIVSAPQFGRFFIDGIAFGAVCDSKGGVTRHGVESLLHFYYHRRISNDRYNPGDYNYIRFKIGQTSFWRAYVVGVDFSQQDANFNIWQWSISLAVSIRYFPVWPTTKTFG